MELKKIALVLTALILLLGSCRKNESKFDGTSLSGTLPSGYVWAQNDSIGVSGTESGNNCFVLNPDGAGSSTGLFKGSMSGTPVGAYYPYNPAAGGTSIKSVSLTLPETQSPVNDGPDRSLDVKMAGKPDGSVREGFTFNFVRKLSQVNISIVPDSELDGKSTSSIIISAKERKLSGTFTMDLEDSEKELNFTKGRNSVTCKLNKSVTFSAGTAVKGWVLVNPSVCKGDSLFISIPTEDYYVIAKITSEWDFKQGNDVDLTLDIAKLRTAGKIFIEKGEGSVFTSIKTCGAYDLSGGLVTSRFKYIEGENQYSTCATVSGTVFLYSILSIEKGQALKVKFKDGAVDSNIDLEITAIGVDVLKGKSTARLVKKEADMRWFMDETNNIGYIVTK